MHNKLLDLLYNRKLPQVYRDEDSKIGEPLKRYLESLTEGGYKSVSDNIKNFLLLVDPKSVPEGLFPYLCESFGLKYFPDIDIKYQRRFLANIGELIKRRGTFSSVHFLIRSLTGLEAELSVEDDNLTIMLLANNVEQVNMIEPSMRVISNYIRTQIPYYITPNIQAKVSTIINSKSYSKSAIGVSKTYHINKYKEGN